MALFVEAPSASPSLCDIAWAAGFIEGEGCFSSASVSSPRIRVSQCNIEPLMRIQALFGGSIRPNKPHDPRHNSQYCWSLSGPRGRGLMYTIFTYMSPKRRLQIKEALGIEPKQRWRIQ